MFLCLFNFRAFSFWTWFTFILVVLAYQLGGKTHPLYLLQPGGELLGAAACGGMAAPKKGDRNQGIDATHTDAARQHFAMCTISGVNPRISDTFHRSTTSSPVCRYPYCRGWGNLGRKSLWGYSALHNLGHLGVIRWDFIFVSYWLFSVVCVLISRDWCQVGVHSIPAMEGEVKWVIGRVGQRPLLTLSCCFLFFLLGIRESVSCRDRSQRLYMVNKNNLFFWEALHW